MLWRRDRQIERQMSERERESAFLDRLQTQTVTISDSVTSIGNNAFASCTVLQSLTIPDSVTSIGNELLYLCTALHTVTINVPTISIIYI